MSSATRINLVIEQAHKDGITYSGLASKLGLSERGLQLKRSGARPWKWEEVVTLADFVGVSLDEMRERKQTSVSDKPGSG